jgi:5-methylcytosine-specific restriction endonuclease McrA
MKARTRCFDARLFFKYGEELKNQVNRKRSATESAMTTNSKPGSGNRSEEIIAEARKNRAKRETDYREMALKLFDHVCARCGREFEGRRLRELTVHHRDHNHHNNPPDGSNWELLCVYCHDNEHSRHKDAEWLEPGTKEEQDDNALTHKPFGGLANLLKTKEGSSGP